MNLRASRLLRARSIRATTAERTRALPGDEFIAQPLGSLTHAVTIDAPPSDVWPWIAQMGADRAGWYSYDWIDNGRRASARQIVPELQHPQVGTVFPALPGLTDGFVVLAIEPARTLTLGWPLPDGAPNVTWTFALELAAPGATRLITRVRGSAAYRFRGLPRLATLPVVRLVHFIMERRQLLGIAERAESAATAAGSRRSPAAVNPAA
jgi:hypothetical protein